MNALHVHLLFFLSWTPAVVRVISVLRVQRKWVREMADVSQLPIDIHVSKLLDWLVSRRHVKDKWQSEVTAIRDKITKALDDMPEHPDIAKLLSGSCKSHKFHVLLMVRGLFCHSDQFDYNLI